MFYSDNYTISLRKVLICYHNVPLSTSHKQFIETKHSCLLDLFDFNQLTLFLMPTFIIPLKIRNYSQDEESDYLI